MKIDIMLAKQGVQGFSARGGVFQQLLLCKFISVKQILNTLFVYYCYITHYNPDFVIPIYALHSCDIHTYNF